MSEYRLSFRNGSEIAFSAFDEFEEFRGMQAADGYMYLLIPPANYEALLDAARPSRRWAQRYLRVSVKRYRWPSGPWRGHLGRAIPTRPPFGRFR